MITELSVTPVVQAGSSHLVTGVGSSLLQSSSKIHFVSGKRYQPVAEMSEIADLLKTWMAEARRQEQRREQERVCYAEE